MIYSRFKFAQIMPQLFFLLILSKSLNSEFDLFFSSYQFCMNKMCVKLILFRHWRVDELLLTLLPGLMLRVFSYSSEHSNPSKTVNKMIILAATRKIDISVWKGKKKENLFIRFCEVPCINLLKYNMHLTYQVSVMSDIINLKRSEKLDSFIIHF